MAKNVARLTVISCSLKYTHTLFDSSSGITLVIRRIYRGQKSDINTERLRRQLARLADCDSQVVRGWLGERGQDPYIRV